MWKHTQMSASIQNTCKYTDKHEHAQGYTNVSKQLYIYIQAYRHICFNYEQTLTESASIHKHEQVYIYAYTYMCKHFSLAVTMYVYPSIEEKTFYHSR